MKNKIPSWVVVLDDSDCTVGVGGEGYLWEVESESTRFPDCWKLKNIDSPYSKNIFRAATQDEINNWLKNKKRADIPKHNKPLLYQGDF